jgi:hypothetical protein
MTLPERPVSVLLGATPAACKTNLVSWIDGLIRRFCPNFDNFDYDALDHKVDGSYHGLRGGEWAKVVEYMTRPDIVAWQTAMRGHLPPLTCGTMTVVMGGSGRGLTHSSMKVTNHNLEKRKADLERKKPRKTSALIQLLSEETPPKNRVRSHHAHPKVQLPTGTYSGQKKDPLQIGAGHSEQITNCNVRIPAEVDTSMIRSHASSKGRITRMRTHLRRERNCHTDREKRETHKARKKTASPVTQNQVAHIHNPNPLSFYAPLIVFFFLYHPLKVKPH